MASECIFCGKSGPSAEHVWPQWVSAVLRRKGSFDLRAEQVGVRQWEQRAETIPVVTRKVCAACNSGWMSRLECAVRPVLEPMLLDQSTTLDAGAQRILALWILKTAMVLEHAGASIRPKFFRPNERHDLMAFQAIPEATFIWLLRVADPRLAAWAAEDDLRLAVHVRPQPATGTGYASTFSAGPFAFQSISLRLPAGCDATAGVELTNDEDWADFSVPSWPTTTSVSWPPPHSFTYETIQSFAERLTRGGA
jgi:hypothetical protein